MNYASQVPDMDDGSDRLATFIARPVELQLLCSINHSLIKGFLSLIQLYTVKMFHQSCVVNIIYKGFFLSSECYVMLSYYE